MSGANVGFIALVLLLLACWQFLEFIEVQQQRRALDS
jgi:hypothetical protein